MVIAYEDYPWKNPLKIYWASVTGSRKVKLRASAINYNKPDSSHMHKRLF